MNDTSIESTFVGHCCHAFRRLVDVYGFSNPEVERVGRETYVRYRKGDHEVDIAHRGALLPFR